ncbi:MAG: hypothetical protein Q9162_003671 [Coniocarpon cinnabarinum]
MEHYELHYFDYSSLRRRTVDAVWPLNHNLERHFCLPITQGDKAGKADKCINPGDDFARGKERSYPNYLHTKINSLEAELRETERTHGKQSSTPVSSNNPELNTTANGTTDSAPHGRRDRRPSKKRENREVNDLVSNFGLLSINAAARDYKGFSSLMSVARISMWAITRDNYLDMSDMSLPSKAEAQELGESYLQNIFLVLPVIEKSTFYASLHAVYRDQALPYHHYVLRMVIATALIMQSLEFGDQNYVRAGTHAMAAMNFVEDAFRPDNISSIQAMLLLVEYSRYDPRRFDNWTLVGAVTRAAVDLGLHQDPPKQARVARGHLEARRRVFMCLYAMDRLTSIAFQRAFSFSDASTNVDIEASLLDSQLPGAPPEASVWMKPFEYGWRHFQIRQVQSAIWQDLHQNGHIPLKEPYSYIWEKWDEAHQWLKDLPDGRPGPVKDLTILEMIATVVQLLAPSPKVPEISQLAQSLLFEKCIEYCDRIQNAMDDANTSKSLSYTSGIRVQRISHIFVHNFRAHSEWLLKGNKPRSDPHPKGTKAPPKFEYPERDNNDERTLKFIKEMKRVLEYFSTRFGMPMWEKQFRIEALPVESSLTIPYGRVAQGCEL